MAAAREARRRSAFDATLGVRAAAGPAHRAGWAFTQRGPQRVQRRIGAGAAGRGPQASRTGSDGWGGRIVGGGSWTLGGRASAGPTHLAGWVSTQRVHREAAVGLACGDQRRCGAGTAGRGPLAPTQMAASPWGFDRDAPYSPGGSDPGGGLGRGESKSGVKPFLTRPAREGEGVRFAGGESRTSCWRGVSALASPAVRGSGHVMAGVAGDRGERGRAGPLRSLPRPSEVERGTNLQRERNGGENAPEGVMGAEGDDSGIAGGASGDVGRRGAGARGVSKPAAGGVGRGSPGPGCGGDGAGGGWPLWWWY